MAVYVVTGKLGGGKTLISVKRIQDKLEQGCPIATNLDINLQHLISPFNKTCRVIRIPDKPSVHDLNMVGVGNEEYDEEKNGLLVLDECGTWFNSRNWSDKARKPVNDWFLHARKLGWDVILIIQDVSLLDSQARAAIAEHTVFCRRLDRVSIPFFGTFFKLLTGKQFKLPRFHIGRVVYGIKWDDLVTDRWATRGDHLFSAYDTKQLFLEDYPHGSYSMLPPYFTHGRYMAARDWKTFMRLTKIYWKRFRAPVAFGAGALIASAATVAGVFITNYDPNHHHPEPAPVISQDENESLTESVTEVFDPIIEKLTDSKIIGTWSAGGTFSYSIRYIDGQIEDRPMYATLDTMELESVGYEVVAVSGCSVVIKRGNQSVPVFCF